MRKGKKLFVAVPGCSRRRWTTPSKRLSQLPVWLSLTVIAVVAVSPAAGASPWVITTVDSGDAGFYSSLAFDPGDGNPSIAYTGDGRTKFAHWNGSSWDISDVCADTGPRELVYKGAGAPALAYYGSDRDKVYYAERIGSTWVIEQVDDGTVEADASLAFDDKGNPAITYQDHLRGKVYNLNFARRISGSWQVEVVETDVSARYNSLVFDASGNPAVAYGYGDGAQLKYAERNGSSWAVDVVEPGGRHAVMTLDASGIPTIVHVADKAVHLVRRNGSSWDIETVTADDEAVGFSGCTLAFDSAGTAYVGFLKLFADGPFGVLVAKRLGVNSYDIETVDGTLGSYRVSIAIGPNDNPAVAYLDNYPDYDALYAERIPCEIDADCDDGNLCTTDVCDAGRCENTPTCMDDGDACTTDCDPNTGDCSYDPIDCDDGDPCTADSCDPETGCSNEFPECGLEDGCCGPDCDSSNPDPDCDTCGAPGDPCTDNADCCSGKCKGKPGRTTCA